MNDSYLNIFAQVQQGASPIVMLTAHDAVTARVAVEGGVDLILVGDSLAMTVLGYTSTREITLSEMLHHVRAVSRGAPNQHIIGDMPVGTYDTPEQALATARSFLDAGCSSVKFEGCRTDIAEALHAAGIIAIGHIGLTPQTAQKYTVQGKSSHDKKRLLKEAVSLQEHGISLLIIECVPAALGTEITQLVKIPTIGIGAGNGCSGQVLVINDLLGMYGGHTPKFVRQYDSFNTRAVSAVTQYAADVRSRTFPTSEESYH